MKLAPLLIALALGLTAAAPALAHDAAFDARIESLAHGWDHVNFEIRDKAAQAAAAAKLAAQADALAHQYPARAEPLVWEAIALSTEAGAKGGLGGLALAKEAKGLLERAERLNPAALGDGSVYTSLGSLYAQVPGFPVGFGDPAKARVYLLKGLAANPNGIDSNYFYADCLVRQGQYAGAIKALEKALAAPARPGREVADRGRRAEAQALLARARLKLRGG
ncbi:MAG: tetratricopeptide repeat protein [Caulobacter sp.]